MIGSRVPASRLARLPRVKRAGRARAALAARMRELARCTRRADNPAPAAIIGSHVLRLAF